MIKASIGLLGLGARSTTFYIEQLNKRYRKLYRADNTFPFKLLNTNFCHINSHLPNNVEKLKPILLGYIHSLINLDIKYLLIPNITLHETLDQITCQIKTPLIHPIHATIDQLKANSIKNIVIFGSMHTMCSNYLPSIFKANNIVITHPTQQEINLIDEVRQKTYHYRENDSLIKKFNALLTKYQSNNTVVISCTELSIAAQKVCKNSYDMASIQIDCALKRQANHQNTQVL